MPKRVAKTTGCESDDNTKLSTFAKARRVAAFDDPSGHSFKLMNEFLMTRLDPMAFFAEESVIADTHARLPVFQLEIPDEGGTQKKCPPFALAFTRRWTNEYRPSSANDNDGTLFVIAIRHLEEKNSFGMEFRYKDNVLSFGGSSRFEYSTQPDAPMNLALVINIPDRKLKAALQGAGGANLVLGNAFISLTAECRWRYEEEYGWGGEMREHVEDCSVGVNVPPNREELSISFTSKELKRLTAEDLLTSTPTIDTKTMLREPITVGFELEDAGVRFPKLDIKTCRRHKAKVDGYRDTESEVGMIVGSDVPSGQTNTFCDLEVKSIPFHLFDNTPIARFMSAYKTLYEDLLVVDGLKEGKAPGQNIQPQVTVSVPFDRISSFIESAPLIWPVEEEAIATFKSLEGTDYRSLGANDSDRVIVDTMGEFLVFYLARVWPNVASPQYAIDHKLGKMDLNKLNLLGSKLDLSNKAFHGLFLKDVKRNGVKANGVVDLYFNLRGRLTRPNDFAAVLVGILDGAVEPFFDRTFREEQATSLTDDPIPFMKEFNASYVSYLEGEALAIIERRGAYEPGHFDFAMDLGSRGVTNKILCKCKLTFSSLTELRENRIKPVEGQEASVYFEERRLAGFLSTEGYASSEVLAKKEIVRRLVELRGLLKSDEQPEREALADIFLKALVIMVLYYRKLFEKDA